MTKKFVITGLPRTRSAWLSAYFTQGDVLCYHEATLNFDDMNIEGYTHVGNADCGYTICPDWIEALGDHKLVVIHRDPLVVAKSLEGINFPNMEIAMLAQAERLKRLERALHIPFEGLNSRLEEIHEYLGIPGYDAERAHLFFNLKIQSLDWSK